MSLQPVTISDTVKCLKKLSNGTSYGNDKLDALSIKIAAENLIAPINFLTNLSIEKKKVCE